MKKVSILIILFFATNMVVAQSLVSMTPNAMVQGSSTIVSTITGSGTLFQNGSPPNSIVDVTLSGPATYNLFTGGGPPNGYLTVTDDEHADVDVSLPINAPVGIYSLSVTYYDCCPGFSTPITLTLPNAFTIIAPDGYAQGTIYKDYNQNNVKDAGEPGVSNIYVTANPGNRTVGTDASGNYSVPLLNGNYTITYNANSHNYLFLNSGSPNPINITIANANSTGNDFPVYNGLTSVNPDTA
ncbi:MAG TPA: SdrD B-like domain-containing protein, partial [Bacteroidia bacterium]|nr:SdrD B-like domain-containing protein [Bacteroidia bacterium]